jgi:hypothetical protein
LIGWPFILNGFELIDAARTESHFGTMAEESFSASFANAAGCTNDPDSFVVKANHSLIKRHLCQAFLV